MSEQAKTFAIYAITKHGLQIAQDLYKKLGSESDIFVSTRLWDKAPEGAKQLSLPMGPTLDASFETYDCHVFVISVGAVVRMVAKRLKNKKVDPAVVCVDDGARFSICVLSGHVGRGNEFTHRVADCLGALPIVTTASDVRGTLTVDILGRELGWVLDDHDRNVTLGCAAVVNECPVLFVQMAGEGNFWPLNKALPPGVRYSTDLDSAIPADYEMLLICTDKLIENSHPAHWKRSVIYRPKSLWLGLGCDRDTPFDLVERGVLGLLKEHGLSFKSVKGIATIDKKADERALLQLSEKYNWPLQTYSAEQLDVVPGIQNPSPVVKKYVGTQTVAEGASLLAAGTNKLLVSKVKYTEAVEGKNMTFAVSRIPCPPRIQTPQTQEVAKK